jgi:hypothetical protein
MSVLEQQFAECLFLDKQYALLPKYGATAREYGPTFHTKLNVYLSGFSVGMICVK